MIPRIRARLARHLTLRTAFALMAASSAMAGVAALTAIQASDDAADAAAEAKATADRLEAFILESQQAQCEGANESRGELRHAIADTLTNNLVEAARTPPDPVAIERYRTGLLEDLEADFAGRAWDPDTSSCIDVPVPP